MIWVVLVDGARWLMEWRAGRVEVVTAGRVGCWGDLVRASWLMGRFGYDGAVFVNGASLLTGRIGYEMAR